MVMPELNMGKVSCANYINVWHYNLEKGIACQICIIWEGYTYITQKSRQCLENMQLTVWIVIFLFQNINYIYPTEKNLGEWCSQFSKLIEQQCYRARSLEIYGERALNEKVVCKRQSFLQKRWSGYLLYFKFIVYLQRGLATFRTDIAFFVYNPTTRIAWRINWYCLWKKDYSNKCLTAQT